MAVTKNTGGHFRMRLAGLTGLMAVIVGLVLWLAIEATATGIALLIVGAALLLFAALVELKGLVAAVTSQRGAMGTNVALQIALALVLLAGVNAFSFWHYVRFDWTSDRLFTIKQSIRKELEQLRGETDIVVYLRSPSAQTTDNKLAHFQAAAQRQIIEKVKDLAEEFQELGPRFHVEIVNVQEEDFEPKLAAIKAKSKDLSDAIEKAPENSVFFYSQGRVQRLGFNDIYQLDSEASLAANDRQGNLILNYQGVRPFANKILNIEEKKPRVGVAVVHEVLSLEDPDDPRLTMVGVKKLLNSYGFEARDVILKKWPGPEPIVYTFDESRYEGLEDQRLELDASIKEREKEIRELANKKQTWKNTTVPELNKLYAIVVVAGARSPALVERARLAELDKSGRKYQEFPNRINEELRRQVLDDLETDYTILELGQKQERKELAEVVGEQKNLNVENLDEQRRITDLGAKMRRWLGDVDLLILPRLTAIDIPRGEVIPNRLYKLDDAQLSAVKDFIRAGKPVLFLLGPANESRRDLDMPDLGAGGPDSVETMLTELGFKLPKQTVLFNVETKSFAERRGNLIIQGTQVEVPPVEFDWKPGAGWPGRLFSSRRLTESKPLREHPIRTSVRLAQRSAGKGEAMDLRLRHPRPVYYEPAQGEDKPVDHTLMMATAESWNEDNPFPSRERTPHFEQAKKDPGEGTVEEKRRGPFPIAAAAQVEVPPSWFDKGGAGHHRDRIAVIGQGGVFAGTALTPVRAKLLLDTCNWLLAREDLLAKNNVVWEYPRVLLSDTEKDLWHWGTFLGMPLAFVYTGLVVFMVRRMR